jgi:site-specific recombinase XerD
MDSLLESTYARFWKDTKIGEEANRLSEHAVNHFGSTKDPREITSSSIDAWVATLQKAGNQSPTINRKLSALGKMLRYAMSRGIIDKVPHMERYRESKGRIRWYTIPEERKILAGFTDERVRDFFVFLFDTGCRLSEGLGVQVRDVSTVAVTFEDTKNHKRRTVPLTSRLRGIVGARKESLGPDVAVDASFWGVSEDHVRNQWALARTHAGLEKDKQAVIHTCRHTFASRLVQEGVSLQVVQTLLGHATLTMTLRYAHLAPSNVEQAIGVLDRVQAA